MKCLRGALVLLALVLCSEHAAAKTCTVESYGAKGDGVTLDTQAIQQAANNCTSNGTLTFTSGKTYLTGTIKITGSVTVVLPKNSTVKSNGQRSSYYATQPDWYLLYFFNCHGCSLDGGGTVDGNADLWVTGSQADIKDVINWQDSSCPNPLECRPRLVGVRQSSQVRVGAVNLINPIYWNLHIFQSTDITVENTYIYGDPRVPNNDGMDIDSSQNVLVAGVSVSTCDDAICFKANDASMPTKNVWVENCKVVSKASGYKLGTESLADFSNITVINSQVLSGTHRALSIQLRDKGNVKNVTFENISAQGAVYEVGDWWGAAEALYITSIPRFSTTQVGTVSGVTVRNLNVTSENGIVMVGMPSTPIQNVAIIDTVVSMTMLTDFPGGFMDLRPSILGKRTGTTDSGLYVENVNQLELQNLQIIWNTPARPTWGGSFMVSNHSLTSLTQQGFTITDKRAEASSR